jgi:hypothetical protein
MMEESVSFDPTEPQAVKPCKKCGSEAQQVLALHEMPHRAGYLCINQKCGYWERAEGHSRDLESWIHDIRIGDKLMIRQNWMDFARSRLDPTMEVVGLLKSSRFTHGLGVCILGADGKEHWLTIDWFTGRASPDLLEGK